jgi:hypothetical protein
MSSSSGQNNDNMPQTVNIHSIIKAMEVSVNNRLNILHTPFKEEWNAANYAYSADPLTFTIV